MKLGRLNHVGVVTASLDNSVAFYRDVMGATDITEPMDMPEQGVRLCFVNSPTVKGPTGEGTQMFSSGSAPVAEVRSTDGDATHMFSSGS